MSTTTIVSKVGATNETLNVDTITRANLGQRKTVETPNGYSTEYILTTGDSSLEYIVTVNANYDPKGNGGTGVSRYTIRVTSRQITTDDTTGEVLLNNPIEAGVFLSVPGKGMTDVTLAKGLLQNAFALTYPSVTTSEADSGVLDSLANFITGGLYS